MTQSVSQKVEKTLLADIEKIGLPLDQVSLIDICDAKEGIYGAPGKSRRAVQLRFQKIKELTARGYRKLLSRYSITPGPATMAAEQQEQEAQEQLPDQDTPAQDADKELVLSDDEELMSDDEDITTDPNPNKDITTDLASAFGSISIEESKSSRYTRPNTTPCQETTGHVPIK
jgi:hypothetical protein